MSRQKGLSNFNEDFIKNMMKIVIQDIFLKQMQSIQMRYLIVKDLAFLPQRKKGGKTGFVVQKNM